MVGIMFILCVSLYLILNRLDKIIKLLREQANVDHPSS